MKQLKSYLMISSGLLLAVGAGAGWAADGFTSDIAQAVRGGTVGLDFRYRFEGVDQDGISKDAEASTLRSRITATSGSLYGFTALGEVDNVTVIGSDHYNSTVNGESQYPVVADPKGTEVNQVYLAPLWLFYHCGLRTGCRLLPYRILLLRFRHLPLLSLPLYPKSVYSVFGIESNHHMAVSMLSMLSGGPGRPWSEHTVGFAD